MSGDPEREHALEEYKQKLLESREWEAKLKALRMEIKGLQHDFEVSEDNIKALQSVGQIIGEVLKQLDEERCKHRYHHREAMLGIEADTRVSHRQSIIRTALRRRLQEQARQDQTQAGRTCRA